MQAHKKASRKFADVYPAIKERCLKYAAASKWENVDRMTPGLAKLWVQQLSLWTRSAFKARGYAYASCPHPELRSRLLETVTEEDVVDPRVGMNHRQLLATSLGRATGQDLADLQAVKPLATTLITLDIFHGVANRTWEEGVAIVGGGHEKVLKDTGYFGRQASRLQKDLNWSKEQLAWFTGHDAADEDHGSNVELLDKYVTDDGAWDRIEEAIVQSQIAWLILHDGVVDAYAQGIAPVTGGSCKGLSVHF